MGFCSGSVWFGITFPLFSSPCVPARFHGAPQPAGAPRPPSDPSGHPGRKAVTLLQVSRIRDRTPNREGLQLSGMSTGEATSYPTYFWGQSSPDADDHLLLVMVHGHIERGFVNLEKIRRDIPVGLSSGKRRQRKQQDLCPNDRIS